MLNRRSYRLVAEVFLGSEETFSVKDSREQTTKRKGQKDKKKPLQAG